MIALYSRVSTQEQAESGYSIDEQQERMTAYCKAMGWTQFRIYRDAGFSGGNMNRPALSSMIQDIKSGCIQKVLVYKLDRLSRSQKDTLYLIEDVFLANGADFISMSENFDTSSPFGRAMIGILAVFAQLEREQIRERMIMGKTARAKSGRWNCSKAPVGYDLINGDLVVNDYEKMQVQMIFERYLTGIPLERLSREMNEAGYRHKYGEWKARSIREMLQNTVYIGMNRYGGETYNGIHEPIIEPSVFYSVQELLKKNATDFLQINLRPGKANSLLGGFLVCAHCGAKYHHKRSYCKKKNGKIYRYDFYICDSRQQKAERFIKDRNCKNKWWKMDALDNLIIGEIRKLAFDPEPSGNQKSQTSQQIELLQSEIGKIESQISRLAELYSIEQMPIETVQSRVVDLQKRHKQLQQEIERIQQSDRERLTREQAKQSLLDFEEILSGGDIDEIRGLLKLLISRIEVDMDDITIYWNFD